MWFAASQIPLLLWEICLQGLLDLLGEEMVLETMTMGAMGAADTVPSVKSSGAQLEGGVFLILVTGAVFFWWRRRQQRSGNYPYKVDILERPQPYPYDTTYEGSNDPTHHVDMVSTVAATYSISPSHTPHRRSSPPVIVPSKSRQRTAEMEQRYPLSTSGITDVSASLLPDSDPETVSQMGSGSGRSGHVSLAMTDLVGLRAEVENLRRVVHGIREERLDPPPQYGE
ncbi:hypothetical protein L226DRAFT_61122 [Lentinus tigrinus ALCF2SS1-7]|uniref:uncharacterized protein n=1 Tax=Lentinus tigrinus ALCF2SS1-7 TaxID=1328758 RepID=UPI0011663632|nr:hypothetical protein L226DRAFT_61122 [Lentinus tigrinus ALCF2SS1-7]